MRNTILKEKQQKKQPRVIVFSTPTCSYCNMAKNTFDKIKFSFETWM